MDCVHHWKIETPNGAGPAGAAGSWPAVQYSPALDLIDLEGGLVNPKVAGNSPVYSHGCKPSLPVAEGAAGNPSCRTFGRILNFRYSSQG